MADDTKKSKLINTILIAIPIFGALVGIVKLSINGTQTYDKLINGQRETRQLIITTTDSIRLNQKLVEAKLLRDSVNAVDGDIELKNDVHKIYKILKVNQ
jgi:hypothetical protein